jgi:hypothetical protein
MLSSLKRKQKNYVHVAVKQTDILQTEKYHVYNKIRSREKFCFLKISKSLQTTLAVEAHLAEGQFLVAGQTLTKKIL